MLGVVVARSKRIKGVIPRQRGNVRVEIDHDSVSQFVRSNKQMRDDMYKLALAVKAECERTASSAEEGPGGTIDGYADAGFDIMWDARDRIPRVLVYSNAPTRTWLAAHFHTIKRDGKSHMRKAMEVIT